MARIRTVKPELFRHESLFDLEETSGLPVRLVFIGLFTVADRNGVFEWRPRQIKLDVMPYDMTDFSRVLDALVTGGFLVKYEVNGNVYGCIPSFSRHQVINNREKETGLPMPPKSSDDRRPEPSKSRDTDETRRVNDASATRECNYEAEGEREEEREGERELSVDADHAQNTSSTQQEFFARHSKPVVTIGGADNVVAIDSPRNMTMNWLPDHATVATLIDSSIPEEFVFEILPRFASHYAANQKVFPNWNAKFSQWVIKDWQEKGHSWKPSTQRQQSSDGYTTAAASE